MIEFMNKQSKQDFVDANNYKTFQRIKAGKYTGFQNATVTVLGDKGNSNEYIRRDPLSGRNSPITKHDAYGQMNMTHFSRTSKDDLIDESCVHRIYRHVVTPYYQDMMTTAQQEQESNSTSGIATHERTMSWKRPLW